MARILVADDERLNLRLARTVLAAAGHEVLEAIDGEAATRVAAAELPDLVLMDIQMPGMDGFEALKALRAEPRTARLKVVAFTALAMKGDRDRMLDAGFDGYISKPIRREEFIERITALLALAPPGS
jgi:CheY-like chemotaxis protein